MSNEYIGSLVILLMSVLKIFNINLASDEVTAIVTGAVALWVAFKRFQRGDIKLSGVRKK